MKRPRNLARNRQAVSTRSPGRSRAWLTEHRVVLLAGLLAALPVLVAALRALAWHWYPVSDDATIATRAYDVFSAHSPLVGQYSQASRLTGHATYSPGPLLYWLLAVPVRLGPKMIIATISAVNVAAVIGAVALAKRRGGTALMGASAIAIALMCHSLGPERLHGIWNPYVGVLPLLLLIFVCWSVACGEHRLLPLAVLVASFAAQAQVAFLFPAAGLLAVAVGGLAARSRRLRGVRSGSAVRRWTATAFLVGVACWSAPLLDQALHRPGNLVAIVQAGTARHGTLGGGIGWHAVVRTIGIPPWWLRAPADYRRFSDLDHVSAAGSVSAALVLGALLALGLAGLRRTRYDVAAVSAISLVLCGAVAIVAATTPTVHLVWITSGYTLWWASPVGAWIYLSLGWAVASLAGALRDSSAARAAAGGQLPQERAMALAASAALLCAAGYAALDQAPDQVRPLYAPATALATDVDSEVPPHSSVRVDASPPTVVSVFLQSALVYALRREGVDVASGPFLAQGLGGSYLGRLRYDHLVRVHVGESPEPGERVIARGVVTAGVVRMRLAIGTKRLLVRYPVLTAAPSASARRTVTVGLTGAAGG